jgi:uncharacterized protein
MPVARFRFYAELNDFLSVDQRQIWVEVTFNGHETVKHLVESLGVPHTEVDVILINGQSRDFSFRPSDGDEVDVYPDPNQLTLPSLIRLRPRPKSQPCFVLDGHLGKLASYLRLLGFDARYQNDIDDEELAEISSLEGRILLTRDRGLLKRSQVTQGYCVRAKSPRLQVIEVIRRYSLETSAQMFSRCARCNGLLKPISKAEVIDRLMPKTKLYYDKFHICQECNQIYWKGSHFDRMESQLVEMLNLAARGNDLKSKKISILNH